MRHRLVAAVVAHRDDPARLSCRATTQTAQNCLIEGDRVVGVSYALISSAQPLVFYFFCLLADERQMWLLCLAQVYWVYDILKQPRVIATDRDENYISIPLDYNQRFHIIEKGQSNRLSSLLLLFNVVIIVTREKLLRRRIMPTNYSEFIYTGQNSIKQ